MKIVLLGDSITDMSRNRELPEEFPTTKGMGYPFIVTSKLYEQYATKYQVINRGISGDRIVDVYARIKKDCWNLQPDFISVLIGVNDVWHELENKNGVELDRFENVYSMLIEDTLKSLPNVKIMLLEPFVLEGSATTEKFDRFLIVKEYAKVVKKLADKYGFTFVPLQDRFDDECKKVGASNLLYDGVHPTVQGATVIANEWLKGFEKLKKDEKVC
ncbi:MAG: SGNH/GDSL hydrolase family protein [Clostridia bacterium]|nr:SGNH/GDSL hydrolase family protein [Clostridia bacterium]